MIRLVLLAPLIWIASCRDGPEARSADASVVDAQSPDARVAKPHEPPTAAAVAYFADIEESLVDQSLVAALHDKLLADHQALSFAELYVAYETVDGARDLCDGIFDFYSSKCWQPSDACGNYTQEGDCFNREHSWPKSWWGGATGPAQHQDLIAVIPADGYVNNSRGQLPLGDVSVASYVSSNGSRSGICSSVGIGPAERCFEPPDELKGDLARIYFYMAVRYEGEFSCCDDVAVARSDIRPWQEAVLRQWHAEDSVDLSERTRNELAFGFQQNRNPFVDFPSFADRISDF